MIVESIKITLHALAEYRRARALKQIPDMRYDLDVVDRTQKLYDEASQAIRLLENSFPDLYTPDGLARVFEEGFLPVPYLMDH